MTKTPTIKNSGHVMQSCNFLIFLAFVVIGMFSCSTPKNSYYFKTVQNDTVINWQGNKPVESKIKKNDLLSIVISSLNREEDLLYNAATISSGAIVTGGGTANGGYLVDLNGHIQIHRMGNVKAAGLTRRELKEKIETDLKPYLKDPIVTVRFLNHHVTVIGEVSKPTVIQMPEEKLSLLEVLGFGGDVTFNAKRDKIMVIRETEDGNRIKRLNLEDHSIFTSEWYYVQPNDVIYVQPSDDKINEVSRQKKQQTISLALSSLSIVVIILDRLIRR